MLKLLGSGVTLPNMFETFFFFHDMTVYTVFSSNVPDNCNQVVMTQSGFCDPYCQN